MSAVASAISHSADSRAFTLASRSALARSAFCLADWASRRRRSTSAWQAASSALSRASSARAWSRSSVAPTTLFPASTCSSVNVSRDFSACARSHSSCSSADFNSVRLVSRREASAAMMRGSRTLVAEASRPETSLTELKSALEQLECERAQAQKSLETLTLEHVEAGREWSALRSNATRRAPTTLFPASTCSSLRQRFERFLSLCSLAFELFERRFQFSEASFQA